MMKRSLQTDCSRAENDEESGRKGRKGQRRRGKSGVQWKFGKHETDCAVLSSTVMTEEQEESVEQAEFERK